MFSLPYPLIPLIIKFLPYILIPVAFILVLALVGAVIGRSERDTSPVVTVNVSVASKHEYSLQGLNNFMLTSYASYALTKSYYAAFETETGGIKELKLTKREFDSLDEGDSGKLTYQGTEYRDFEKIKI
jgi:hypothetical protein